MARVTHPEHFDLRAPTRIARTRFALNSAAFLLVVLAGLAIGGIYITELFGF